MEQIGLTTVKCELIDQLGVGSFGKTYRANYIQRECAIKIFHTYVVNPSDSQSQSFIKELQRLKYFTHKYIVKYFDIHLNEERQLVLLMELCCESLTSFLGRNVKPLPRHMEIKINLCIAKAIEYLHNNSLIHGNLSSNNVLMVAENKVKVSDYGMKAMNTSCTPVIQFENGHYMPPQVLSNPQTLSTKVDIFSCGVLQIQIMTRQLPNPVDQKPEGSVFYVELLEEDRRTQHLSMIDDAHPLKKISLQCLRYEDCQTSTDLVQMLKGLKERQKCMESSEGILSEQQQTKKLVVQSRKLTQEPTSTRNSGVAQIDLLLLGDIDVGKTNLTKVYVGEYFGKYKCNVGAPDCCEKIISHRGQTIQLNIWDTSGQEKFLSLTFTRSILKRVKGVMVVYDVTSKVTFLNVPTWIERVKEHIVTDDVEMILVGNKIDIIGERKVSEEEGRRCAAEHCIPFFETSALKDKNIEEVFSEMVSNIVEKNPLENRENRSHTERISLHHSPINVTTPEKKKCCKH